MKYAVGGYVCDVIISKKNNKNTYIRVKEDMNIYVTTSHFTTKTYIKKLLDNNTDYLKKMLDKRKAQIEHDKDFYYLGNKYDIILVSSFKNVEVSDDKIYVKDRQTLEKWYKNQTKELFNERLKYNYDRFLEDIPYPTLKIRNMKTRWGVCNRKNKTVTLNSNLIKYDLKALDYVIVHELSHFVHFDHSKNFWALVSKYCQDYKKIRTYLRD